MNISYAFRTTGWFKKLLFETMDSFVFNSNFYEPPCIKEGFL